MTAASVLEGAGFDFSELDDDTTVEAKSGPLSGSRNRGGATGTTQRRRRASKGKLDSLQKALSQQMFMAGTMMGLALPVTGYYINQESDRFTKAVVELAAHKPEWIEALEHLSAIQPGLIIGRTAIGIGAAIAVDRDKVDPERRALQFLGVTQAWLAVHTPGEDMEGSAYVPPPSSFERL